MSKQIPQLTESEQLQLQNILLRIALEKSRAENYEIKLMDARSKVIENQQKLEEWNKKFNVKLNEIDLDLSKVGINADTGEVTLLSNQMLRAIQ